MTGSKKLVSNRKSTIDAFMDKSRVPVKLADLVIKPTDRQTGHKFPQEDILILEVLELPSVTDMKLLRYFNPKDKIENQVYVPNELELFERQVKAKGEEIVGVYDAHYMANLPKHNLYRGNVGSDPEIFMQTGKKELLPAFLFLGGKENPSLDPSGRHVNGSKQLPIYWDGFQAEFQTAPATCMQQHTDSIQRGLSALLQLARKYDSKASFLTKPTVDISAELLAASKPEHVAFGCMPSFNAYGLKGLDLPGEKVPYRSSGGHIHFGIGKHNEETVSNMVKALDSMVGVACVSLFETFDDMRRRTMYGLAGEYRLPPHGLEYRTLSNAWMFHPMIANLVFDFSRKVLWLGKAGMAHNFKAEEKEVISIIQNNDVKGARKLMTTNKALILKLLEGCYGSHAEIAYNVFMKPMEDSVKDPTDVIGNWDLTSGNWNRSASGKAMHTSYDILSSKRKVS